MNSKTLGTLAIVIVLAAGAYYVSNSWQSAPGMEKSGTAMAEPTVVMTAGDSAMMKKESRYTTYSKASFDAAKGKKRVYFFYAPWCPTCRPADSEFQTNMDSIPEDVVLFKTDYDSSNDLKRQYGVTYQHTYVLVDDSGKEIKKWNGGGIDELIANTQ